MIAVILRIEMVIIIIHRRVVSDGGGHGLDTESKRMKAKNGFETSVEERKQIRSNVEVPY